MKASNRPLVISAVWALTCLWLGCGARIPQRVTTATDGIIVSVQSFDDNSDVEGARVFILTEDGREISAEQTDTVGFARLTAPGDQDSPKYVMVRHRNFFLGGDVWRPGVVRYRILLAPLTIE
jgi:hypothetical protein